MTATSVAVSVVLDIFFLQEIFNNFFLEKPKQQKLSVINSINTTAMLLIAS